MEVDKSMSGEARGRQRRIGLELEKENTMLVATGTKIRMSVG